MKSYTLGVIALVGCIAFSLSYFAITAMTWTLQVDVHLAPIQIEAGDTLTINANATNYLGTPINEATVTAMISDLEIIYFLTQQGDGYYRITINPPRMTPGTYTVTVTVQKEGYNLALTSKQLIISTTDYVRA